MSDRIAVFNEGRIEQVGARRDLRASRQPVRRRLRGCLQPARARRPAVHGPAREDRDPRDRRTSATGFTPRRRDPGRRLRGNDHPLPGRARRRGRTSSHPPEPRDLLAEAQEQRGRKVKIGWRADQTVAVEERKERSPSETETEEPPRMGRRADRWRPVRPCSAFAGCGGDDDGGGGGGGAPTEVGETEGALNLVAWPGYVEARRSRGCPSSRRRPAARST